MMCQKDIDKYGVSTHLIFKNKKLYEFIPISLKYALDRHTYTFLRHDYRGAEFITVCLIARESIFNIPKIM